jgi:hypothetical protein
MDTDKIGKISWKRVRAGRYVSRAVSKRGLHPLFEIEHAGPGSSPWQLTSVYTARESRWETLQQAKDTADYLLNAPKCSSTSVTHSFPVLATCRISYNFRGEDEVTTDYACTVCAESYERRPVLKNFARLPLTDVRA